MNEPDFELEYRPGRRNGKSAIVCNAGGRVGDVAELNVVDPTEREKFAARLVGKFPGLNIDDISDELTKIANEVTKSRTSDTERESQADRLVKLADGVELFHTPGGHNAEGYASIRVGNPAHRETWPLRSKTFRRWLSHLYCAEYEKVPNAQAVLDALSVLEGKAIFDGPEHDVSLRIAEHHGDIWLDLCDAEWRAVKISRDGWSIEMGNESPVRFVRRNGMLPLPLPLRGGQIDELRALVNLPDDLSWTLVVAFLIGSLRSVGPYPVLVVNGEHGSAKTTLCRFVRDLIDPHKVPLRRPPKDERDLMIAASNSWMVGLDNLSGLSVWMSDALCSLATGGGFAARQLFTDGDEIFFEATRPIMANGIDDFAARPDLMDRALHITLPAIPDEKRQEVEVLQAKFDDAKPLILGALLDAGSCALREWPNVCLDRKPRMADFARWVTAAEESLGWAPGSFLDVYEEVRRCSHELALEASPVATAIMQLMEEQTWWEGTSADLLKILEDEHADEKTRRSRNWPESPRGLSSQLTRVAPNLRADGIEVIREEKRTKRGRQVVLRRVPAVPSPPSLPSPVDTNPCQTELQDELRGDGSGDGRETHARIPSLTVTPSESIAGNDLQTKMPVGDGSDRVFRGSHDGSINPQRESFDL